MEQENQQSNVSLNLCNTKAARIEDQLRFCSDQIQKLEDNKLQNSGCLENTQRRLSDIIPSSQQVRDSVVELQARITSSRVTRMELQTELEKERFSQKTVEEDLEVARRNLSQLKAQNEDSSVTDKLQQELGEYREIVKCSICRDRIKEVYHNSSSNEIWKGHEGLLFDCKINMSKYCYPELAMMALCLGS
ncbi:hypothetical protein RYX36_025813 [Vicia faba]